LGIIILLLILLLTYFARKYGLLLARGGINGIYKSKQAKHLLAEAEKELEHSVDAALPSHELDANAIKSAKNEIKENIHETLNDVEGKS